VLLCCLVYEIKL